MSRIHSSLALGLGLLLASGLCSAEESSLKDSTRTAVSGAISAGKNLLGGITEGVTDGRTSTEGVDGAQVISSGEQLAERIQVEVLKVSKQGDDLKLTLGLKNASEQALRLINLTQPGSLLVIDQDGYASVLVAGLVNPDAVTVPASAGVRQAFVFEGPVEGPVEVRLWSRKYPLKVEH